LFVAASNAVGALGNQFNPLRIAVSVLAGFGGAGGLSLLENDHLEVGDVAVSVIRATEGTSNATILDRRNGLVTGFNGSIVLRTTSGTITVAPPGESTAGVGVLANGSGNILLQAQGANSDVFLGANVQSGTGDVSILSPRNVSIGSTAVVLASGAGNLDVEATTGSVSMAVGAGVINVGGSGNVRFWANGDLTLTHVDAGSGALSAISGTGRIADAGDAHVDIAGGSVRLWAPLGIGAENPLETSVQRVSAHAGSDIRLIEQDSVSVGLTDAIRVRRVMETAVTRELIDGMQSDLVTTNGGAILLQTINGSITLESNGSFGNPAAVSASGAGIVTLDAQGTGSDLVMFAGARSNMGNIQLSAARSVLQKTGATISTDVSPVAGEAGSSGVVSVTAVIGDILQEAGALIITADAGDGGDIRLEAGGNIQVSRIQGGRYASGPGEINLPPVVSATTSFTISDGIASDLQYLGVPFGDVDTAQLLVTVSTLDGAISATSSEAVTVGGKDTARTFTGSVADLNSYFTAAGNIRYTVQDPGLNARILTTTATDGRSTVSAASSMILVSGKVAQTITFGAIGGKTFGERKPACFLHSCGRACNRRGRYVDNHRSRDSGCPRQPGWRPNACSGRAGGAKLRCCKRHGHHHFGRIEPGVYRKSTRGDRNDESC
jgi:hypothetical protein